MRDRPAQVDAAGEPALAGEPLQDAEAACRRVSAALPSMSCTLVTPVRPRAFSAARTASRISLVVGFGNEPADQAHRVVLRTPVGVLPSASGR